MNWPGKSSVFFVTVFALVLAGLFAGTARAAAPGDRSGEESSFFHTSFPLEGGPYIIAASFWDASETDTSYTGEADSLFVVFNQPVNPTEVELADFEFAGFNATTIARVDDYSDHLMVVLTGITGMDVGADSVQVDWRSVEGGPFPYNHMNNDIGPVPITTGPILMHAVLDYHYEAAVTDLAPNLQTVYLLFDHPVKKIDNLVFRTTPELVNSALTVTIGLDGRWVRLARSSGNMFNMYPGITKIYLEAGDMAWSNGAGASNDTNQMAQKLPLNNQPGTAYATAGPALMAAYYNDKDTADETDDEVWIALSEPVDPTSMGNPYDQYQLDVDGDPVRFGSDAVQRRQPESAEYASCIVVQNPDLWIDVKGARFIPSDGDEIWLRNLLEDYQHSPSPARRARITRGVGITRAIYFDSGTNDPGDDELHIWFSQALVEPLDLEASDFVLWPAITNFSTQITFAAENRNGLGHAIMNGFQDVVALGGNRLPSGYIIRLAANTVEGVDTEGQGCDYQSYIPIFDDSEPLRIRLDEVSTRTFKIYDPDTNDDTAYLAWEERSSSTDDSDQYFLFFTNQDGTPLNQQFIANYRDQALPVGNLLPRTITGNVVEFGVDITEGVLTTDLHPIAHGDQLRFMLVPATYWGVMADGDGPAVLKFQTPIFAGPICPPRDFVADEDDDMIHVTATRDGETGVFTHQIYGDADSAPCGTRIYVYDGDDPMTAHLLGWGPIDTDGSFDPITLDGSEVDLLEIDWFYVYAWDNNAYSVPVMIRNDRFFPMLTANAVWDRFNPPQIYKFQDYVNILLKADDRTLSPVPDQPSWSDLLDIRADFTNLDNRTTLPANLGGHPVGAVPLASLGNDDLDNDGDWVADEPLIDRDTDGEMDFPEPYVDENGDGDFDLGETFVDQNGNDVCDCDGGSGDEWDWNLDSADPDEHSWYEVRLLASGDADRFNDVVKGFQLLDPVTDPNGQGSFGEILDLPVPFDVRDSYLDQSTWYGDDTSPFKAEVDEVAPTVAKVEELYSLGGFLQEADPGDNLIIPTDPTYHLARYLDFAMRTPSDEDVLFAVTQIRKVDGTWMNLTLDPPGHNPEGTMPGVATFDDDRDGVENVWGPGVDENGLDDDEDGVIDNKEEGIEEGTDLHDPQVVDAMQDETADANADGGDGVYRTNDRRDNDNDAFFVFEPYYDPGTGALYQRVVWYNIDESTENDIDDDGDGLVDEADEVETYDPTVDDNEDGIMDGEARFVILWAAGVKRMYAVFDEDYTGGIWVDAAHVEGAQGGDADNDIRELTEFVGPGYGVLDPSGIQVHGTLPAWPWGDDAHHNAFQWGPIHQSNIDFWHIAQIAFGEIPDGVQEYQLRAVAYDQPGNVNADYSVPITFTVDVVPPEVALTDCPDGGYPADFVDVAPGRTGMQIYDRGSYTLTTENDDDAVEVVFEYRTRTSLVGDVEAENEAGNDACPGQTIELGDAVDDAQITPSDDEDWYAFEVSVGGTLITIGTEPPTMGGSCDTYLELYDVCGGTRLAYDDDSGPGLWSLISNFVATHSGTYYVKVREWGGSTGNYRLFVTPSVGGSAWTEWTTLCDDISRPFTCEWDASTITIPQTPPDASVFVEFRAYGMDQFGNVQDVETACVDQVEVIDGTAPWTWFTLIHETANPNNDVPDVMDPPDTGSMPNPYYYRDVIGPLQVPRGPAIDIWALFSPGEGWPSTTEHDVIRVVFEYSLAGSGVWTPFETVTGHVDPEGQTIDLTLPVAVTLDTEALETGTYDIRVYACDLEGNNCTPADEAPTTQYDIAKITVVEEGLRAYIQPVCPRDCDEDQPSPWIDLYAINWIHDYFIDHVLFQYYLDADGDGIDNDGNTWYDIDTDGGGNDDPRGDIVLHRGTADFCGLEGHAAFDRLGDADGEGFIDYDGDGYSEKDPIIRDVDGSETYNAGDVVLVGNHYEIMDHGLFTLTDFAPDEFHTGEGNYDATEWIFRENGAPGQPMGEFEQWHVHWDTNGIDQGTYLLRAVATDIMFGVDDMLTSPTVIPTVSFAIDRVAPEAVVATVTTPDGTTVDAVNDLYFDGATGWLKLCATTDATDISTVEIQFRIPGHPVFGGWNGLDVNDDEDFFADIDGIPGRTAEDEIFLDTGSVPFVWDEGDIPLYLGANGVLDAAGMVPPPALIPNSGFYVEGGGTIVEENGAAPHDDDHDGMSEEDTWNSDDWHAPYCVYFGIPPLGLFSDTNIEFRAVATDQSCNTDEDPEVVRLMIGETDTPETDVVWAKRADGTEFDVWPLISDGSDVTQLGAADIADPVTIMVTGEDETAITQVDLKYRKVGECYDLDEWDNPWRSMSADGYTTLNTSYDYPFTVDLGALEADHGYGVYEFYPEAKDNEGNVTPPPVNPYRFKIMTNYATIAPLADDHAAPGDEVWFDATLETPDAGSQVAFLYAERVLDMPIDASRITTHPDLPVYMTLPVWPAMVTPEPSAVLTILRGETPIVGEYFASVDELIAAGGEGDWAYDPDPDARTVLFRVMPLATDAITVSYNSSQYAPLWTDMSGWSQDDDAPYTAAWDQPHGGVPEPASEFTSAYDIVATVSIGEGQCVLQEGLLSEGTLLHLVDESAPEVYFYGRGLCNANPWTNWPGNPSFDTVAGLTEWKLSGVEHEFFVSASGEIAGVDLVFTGAFTGATETRVPMTKIVGTTVPMTFTLYESDFPDVMYGFENVGLEILGEIYPMTETQPGIWQVAGIPVPTGADTPYTFAIDQDGNDWDDSIPDPRNWRTIEGPPPTTVSSVKVPFVSFWFAAGPSLGSETAVWKVRAEASDTAEPANVGMTQDYTFVYDPVAPTVDELTSTHLRFNENEDVTLNAFITDPVPADFNVITVKSARFQYSPNYTVSDRERYERVWLDLGTDTDPTDGWALVDLNIPDPEFDGFDNDGDGLWDEADEATSDMAFRVLALDDGHNYGTPLELPFILDSTDPAAVLTSPLDGAVIAYGATITVAADITETEEDVAYVIFQYNAGEGWKDIDITPEDDSDHPFDVTAPYAVPFNTTLYLDEADTYVRFRAVAVDVAGNQEGDPLEVLTVVDDITGPTAYPIWARTSGAIDYMHLTDPHVAVNGHDARIKGTAVDPSGRENLARVRVQYQLDGAGAWTDIAVVPSDAFTLDGFDGFTVGWEVAWDVVLLPEGSYHIRAIAEDLDGNADPDPIVVTLRVDRTAPTVRYDAIAGSFAGFAPAAGYQDDGTPGTSMALVPDPVTGDLTFAVITPSADVQGIQLQWHQEGTHDMGEWEAFGPSAAFDYEPNLDFSYGGTPYHVWRMHYDDFVNYCTAAGIAGVMEIRALATDYAGNANILHDAGNPWKSWTVDIDPPAVESFTNNSTADQVESGQPVTLNIVMTDPTTDVALVRFDCAPNAQGPWTTIDPNPATEEIEPVLITGENIDTPHCRWLANIVWYTPYPMVQDVQYHVRAMVYDTAGNRVESQHQMITVEDNIKPDFTKIWAIPAVVDAVYEEGTGQRTPPPQDVNCEHRRGLFVDKDGDDYYDPATDVTIDLGRAPDGNPYLLNQAETDFAFGDEMATWPRAVDEVVLGGEITPMVARLVTLVARTQIHDTGLEKVEFWAVNAAGDRILIDVDECPPAYDRAQYFWHGLWDTQATWETGAWKYPDGTYRIVPIAYDTEGNVEDWPAVLTAEYATVIVDNTAPLATADANAQTTPVETAITIERNGVFQLFARTESETEDDHVNFYFKRAHDLNMDQSYTMVPEDEGLDASDDNPDYTRPFVFDWDLDKMDEPFPLEDPVVGVPFHFVATGGDLLDNEEAVTDAFEAGRYVTFTVVDTRAPVATITEIKRITGNTTEIEMPHLYGPVHARDLAYLKAKILGLDNDTEKVDFMYALPGQTTPTLINGDVERDPDDPYTWRIWGWDLSPLAGQTLQVFAVGTDDVGNSDFNPATGRPIAAPYFTLVVDYTAPVVEFVRPTDGMKECRDDVENTTYQLLVRTTETDIDPLQSGWFYKLSSHTPEPENWTPIVTPLLFDAGTGTWAGNWVVDQLASDIYDLRLRVVDYAGNVSDYCGVPPMGFAAQNVVVDTTPPWGEMSRVVLNGQDYFPTMPMDISSGDVIGLWATAHDLTAPEQGKPLHTGIAEVIFQAAACPVGENEPVWRDLGLWQPPTGTIFEEVTATIDWNTSGMGKGLYWVRAWVVDDECNTYETTPITLRISDIEPPRARIAAIQPWRIPHGDDPTTFADIYADAYSDSTIAEVQFQYSLDGTTWIPFGISQDPVGGDFLPPDNAICNLWYAQIDLRSFTLGQNVWLRAIAKDEMGNQDEAAPVLATTLVRLVDGTLNLVPGDLGEVEDPEFVMMGFEEPEQLVVSVTMADADQVPLVMWTWPMPEHEGGGAECLEMTRMIDNPLVWRGDLHLPEEDCGPITIYANALQDGAIDLHSTTAWSYEVNRDLGTNGTVTAAGYRSADDDGWLYATGNFPDASGGVEGCFMIAPSVPPTTSADQARFMTMLDRTCYFMAMIEDYEEHDIHANYWPTMSIEYDEAALVAACGGDAAKAAEMEQYLTVREANWFEWSGEWSGEAITHVTVDPVANRVTFMCQEICYLRPFFALFVPKWNAPVRVRSFTRSSPDPSRWTVTDRDPVIVADLNSIGAEDIDSGTIEVWIDGNLVASRNWVQGGGTLTVEQKDNDGILYQVIYSHSTEREWRLASGMHRLNVTYKTNGIDEWVSLPPTAPGAVFYVDAAPPTVELHSGYVNSPALHNADGYIRANQDDMLTVRMYDAGSGVLVEPMRLSDGQDEMGIKYDLWVVDREDDQWGIDEIEERILLHTGTASEVVPFIQPPVYDAEGTYVLADESFLSIPTVAGGHLIGDGDVLEVVLYSKKHVEEWVDSTEGCDGGFIWEWDIFEEMPPDTIASIYWDCYVDNLGLHVYEQGILDWAGNVGAEFAEYRFVVDQTAPQVTLVAPAGGVAEPGEEFCFNLAVTDLGSGVNEASVVMSDPHGVPVDLKNVTVANGRITGCAEAILALGDYTLAVDVSDRVQNHAVVQVPIRVESKVLGITEGCLLPNPVNPSDGLGAKVHFVLSRPAEVTVKVYDFAGTYVATLANGVAYPAGPVPVDWPCLSADHQELANGAYMIRVEAYDGTGRKATTIKAAIWREE